MAEFGLGTAKGRIEIDTSSAERSLRGLGSATTSATGTMSKGHPVLGMFARGIATIGVAGVGVVGLGVKLASDMQQAEIAFTQFLGTGEKAKAFLGELQQFAAATPFEFPGLRDTASRLLGVGFASEDIIPILGTVGDSISAIGGGQDKIDQATNALVKMQLQGKVNAETMMQLTEAGIPAWQVLAETLDTTVAEAQKKVTAGQVDVNTLFGALEDQAVPALQRTQGMMEAQSKTLAGLFSTLKDVVGATLVEIAGPIVQSLSKSLPGITDTITKVMKSVGPAFGQVLTGAVKIFGKLLPAIAPIISAFGKVIAKVLKALLPAFDALIPLGVALADSILVLADAAMPLIPIFVDLVKIMAVGLVPVLKILQPILPALLAAFLAFKTVAFIITIINGIRTAITVLWAVMSANPIGLIVAAIVLMAYIIIKNWSTVKTVLIAIFNAIKKVAIAVWNAIKAAAISVWNFIKSVVRGVITAITTYIKIYAAIAKAIWTGIKVVATAVWNGIKIVVKGVFDALKTIFNGWKNIIIGGWHAIRDVAVGIWDGIKAAAAGALEFFKGVVNGIIDGINAVIRAYNALPLAPNVPEVAHLARGTRHFVGGLAIVGEKGPELVYLPAGSKVTANERMAQTLGRSPTGAVSSMTAVLELDGVTLERSVEMAARENRIRLGGRV